MRGGHTRVVHARDCQTHEQCGSRFLESRARFRVCPDQIPGQREGREGDSDRDGHGRRDNEGIVDHVSVEPHPRHAEVVHSGDRQPHEHARQSQQPRVYRRAIEDGEGDGAPDYCREDGGDDPNNVEPNQQRQMQREHSDEMHAPDSETHRHCAATSPHEAAAPSGGADALGDLNRHVGAECRDYDRENDEGKAVGFLDHTQ